MRTSVFHGDENQNLQNVLPGLLKVIMILTLNHINNIFFLKIDGFCRVTRIVFNMNIFYKKGTFFKGFMDPVAELELVYWKKPFKLASFV